MIKNHLKSRDVSKYVKESIENFLLEFWTLCRIILEFDNNKDLFLQFVVNEVASKWAREELLGGESSPLRVSGNLVRHLTTLIIDYIQVSHLNLTKDLGQSPHLTIDLPDQK